MQNHLVPYSVARDYKTIAILLYIPATHSMMKIGSDPSEPATHSVLSGYNAQYNHSAEVFPAE